MKIKNIKKSNFVVLDLEEDKSHTIDDVDLKSEVSSLVNRKFTHIGFNLSHLNYLLSKDLTAFAFIYKKIRDSGGQMIFIGPNQNIMNILHMTGFQKLVKTFSNEKEFLKYLE